MGSAIRAANAKRVREKNANPAERRLSDKCWLGAARPMGGRRYRTPEIGVQLSGGPLQGAYRPRGGRQLGRLEIRVQVPLGPLPPR